MSLQLIDASVVKGRARLLDTVNITAKAGEVTAICGPNGAGKSTALACFSGAITPNTGEARFDGAPLSSLSAKDLAKRRAVLAQNAVLSFPFAAHEVVAMGRAPHEGLHPLVHETQVIADAMRAADVLHLADRNYLTLSGGERQRVQLARCLAQVWEANPEGRPRWLLLDEPTSALDLKHQIALMRLAERFAEEGWGVIAVLHDLRLVRDHADTVYLLRSGRVAAWGPVEDVLSPDRVQEVFELDAPFAI